jgi:predicted dehydrogenase
MDKKLRFGLIGCGRISFKHIEAIVNNYDNAELVALCDLEIEKAELVKKRYIELLSQKNIATNNIDVYQDYQELLKRDDIDIVSIATFSGTHAEITINALKSNKHVIVEKPMALSIKDADEMIETAKKYNRKLTVCHQNRFNSTVQKLRKALEKNRFGKLVHGVATIRWNRNNDYYRQASWRGTWEQDGGTLMNQCIHNIDLLQWMMGPVDRLYAEADTFLRNIEGEDMGAAVLRFKNGAIGIIEGSACIYPKNLEETLSIFGEKGTVRIGGVAINKIVDWKFADGLDDEEEVKRVVNYEDPDTVYGYGHTPLYKDFIDAVLKDREPYITGEDGKKAMEIVLAIYKSRKTGLPVEFPLKDFSTLDMKE